MRARSEAAISGAVDLDHYAMALRAIRSDRAAVTERLSFQREAARILRQRMTAQGRETLALEVRRDTYRKESDDLSAINEELADQQEGD
jgi:urease accessory protein UreE